MHTINFFDFFKILSYQPAVSYRLSVAKCEILFSYYVIFVCTVLPNDKKGRYILLQVSNQLHTPPSIISIIGKCLQNYLDKVRLF